MVVVTLLNECLHRHSQDVESLNSIRKKYESGIYFEVASMPLISTDSLLGSSDEFEV